MTRILTAVLLFAIVVPVLVFSHTPVLPVFLSAVGVMCVWEIFRCRQIHKKAYLFVPSALFTAVVPFAVRYFDVFTAPIVIVFLVYMYFCGVFFYKKASTSDFSFAAFFSLFLALGVYSITILRDNLPYLYLLVFISPWASDAAAMYTGKLFGKKKLCPNISPKKTVAGAVGSMIGTLLVFMIYIFAVNTWFDQSYSYLIFALLALPAGAVIQLGDLSASVVKREYGVKDFGNLLPGHGGVVDRCDSILPLAILGCALYFVLTAMGCNI